MRNLHFVGDKSIQSLCLGKDCSVTIGNRIRDAVETILKTNPAFASTTQMIRGVEYRVLKNVPATIRNLIEACRETHKSLADDYLVFQKERWSYDDFCPEIATAAWILKEDFDVKKVHSSFLSCAICQKC